jgi:hypothetical protein
MRQFIAGENGLSQGENGLSQGKKTVNRRAKPLISGRPHI